MVDSMQYVLRAVDGSRQSIEELARLYDSLRDARDVKVLIVLEEFFAANMCSALGLLHTLLTMHLNSVRVVSSSPTILAALRRNDFLHVNSHSRLVGSHAAIGYRKLCPKDIRYFASHLMQEIGRIQAGGQQAIDPELQRMLPMLIYELFVNAAQHAHAQSIYVCGQYYPKKAKLEFTIVDDGGGFALPLAQNGQAQTSAITWAMERGNTTGGSTCKGLGLAMLRNYAWEADTRIHIASHGEWYQQHGAHVESGMLSKPFPGTLVNLQLRTNYLPTLHSLYE